MKAFRFWCQKVLPLVYDDSLSYYEVLCKCVDYINKLIEQDTLTISEIDSVKKDLQTVEKWIADFDYGNINQIISEFIATAVFFGLTDDGYFVAYIPETWEDVSFGTTGLDVTVSIQPEYGHLVLSY